MGGNVYDLPERFRATIRDFIRYLMEVQKGQQNP